MTNTMEWKEDLRVQLTYLDVPKKYHQGLIDFVEEKLTTARKEEREKIKNTILYSKNVYTAIATKKEIIKSILDEINDLKE
jgi:hypothetical protein